MNIIDLKKEDFLKIQNDFLSKNNFSKDLFGFNFLQSFQWAEIQSAFGQKVVFKSLEINNKTIGFFIAIEHNIWRSKKYWYIPRGPIFFDDQQNLWLDFFLALKKTAEEEHLEFVRLEPVYDNFLDYYSIGKSLLKTIDIQPAKTSFLDLSLTEDELLKQMGQKTRYNIRLAQKKGVEVLELSGDNLADFWQLISVTAGRDNFFIHNKEYYQNLLNYNNGFVRLFAAKFKGEILAMGIFSFFGSTVSYLHGASSNNHRNLMAPYLLHWELIKIAKNEGFVNYDLYGVDEKKWPGVSRFKNGFAGKNFSFPGTFDYVVNKRFYYLYKIFRQARRISKKFFK